MAFDINTEAQKLKQQLDAGWISASEYNFQLQGLQANFINQRQFEVNQQVQSGQITPEQGQAVMIQVQTGMPQQVKDLEGLRRNLDQQVAQGLIPAYLADAEYRRQSGEGAFGQTPYSESIAKEGTRTQGTQLGEVREINPSQIASTSQMNAGRIDPVVQIDPRQIGQINPLQATRVAPAAQAKGTNINPLGQAQTIGVGDSAFYGKQQGLAAQLEQQAAGRGPSLAELQMQAAMDRSLKNQMGALAAQPGVSQGMAARLYGNQAGEQNQFAAGQAAQMRMAEQLAARQQLQGLYQGARAQDVGVQQGNQQMVNAFTLAQGQLDQAQAQLNQANAQFNAGQINQQQLAQAQVNFQTAQQNFQAVNQRQVEQAELGTRADLANQLAANTQSYNQAQLINAANQFNTGQRYTQALNQAQLNQQAAAGNQNAFNQSNIAQGNIAGGISQAGIGANATITAADRAANAAENVAETNLLADIGVATIQNPVVNQDAGGPTDPTLVSDRRLKKKIKAGGSAAREMMDQLAAAIYEYKNKKYGDGRQVGVMAQDLEKSSLGKQMVEKRGGKRIVNFAKGLGAVLAAQADLNQRLKKVEAHG